MATHASAKTDIQRLICYPLIILSTLLTIAFDRSVHQVEVVRYHGEAPGDFLTFRNYAILASHPHADLHVSVPLLYPPPFLLFTVPDSWLPLVAGAILWIGAATLCLVLAARLTKLPWRAIGLGLIAAPNLFCAVTGQSGILVSAMLIIAFGLADTNPLFSGMADALLVIKPQFGLLMPVCYLAQRNWRAVAIAVTSLAGLCVLTTLCFGVGIWEANQHLASAQNMLSAPWPSEFQIEMITPLVLFRSLHASLTLALILQGAASLLAAFACWHLWRRGVKMIERLAPTFCGALATPYGYTYDLPALGVALAALAVHSPRRGLIAFTVFLAFTSLYALISVYLFSTGALFLLAILCLTWPYRFVSMSVSNPRRIAVQ
jgi:hypothetical protein